ncbi:hypothetical protein E2320_006317 [Naja naja]|nr:hypothetical protein E2320_006317 [Naja naja]
MSRAPSAAAERERENVPQKSSRWKNPEGSGRSRAERVSGGSSSPKFFFADENKTETDIISRRNPQLRASVSTEDLLLVSSKGKLNLCPAPGTWRWVRV